MDIYTYLKKDHKKVSDLMERVADCNISERDVLFDQIKRELTVHADAEESTFYAMRLLKKPAVLSRWTKS